MKVFVFDLLAYGEQLEHLKIGNELPYPLPKKYFKPEVAARTYAEHLDAWEELDRLGYDGVGFNEHHCSPYGLMNSPNLLAAAAAQRTKRLKLLIYGNLLPLHEPLRLAEELAMLDCMSNGRLISGFARGIPREYQVHNVPLAQSRARFEEAFDIIRKAWTEEVFSYQGRILVLPGCRDVAAAGAAAAPADLDADRRQQGVDRVRRPARSADHPGLGRSRGLRDDIIRYYARCLAQAGHRITPDHLSLGISAYVADSKAEAVREMGPYHLYFNRTLFSHGNFTETELQRQRRLCERRLDRLREPGKPARRAIRPRRLPQPDDGRCRAAGRADAVGHRGRGRPSGSSKRRTAPAPTNVQISLNRGVLPHEMFIEQIRRFAARCCRHCRRTVSSGFRWRKRLPPNQLAVSVISTCSTPKSS